MKSHHIYSHLLGILCVCQLYLNKTGEKRPCRSLSVPTTGFKSTNLEFKQNGVFFSTVLQLS